MKAFNLRGMRLGGAGPDVLSRRLRTADLPIAQSSAQVERATAMRSAATRRELLRVSGFGAFGEGEEVVAGGASAAGFELGMGSGLGRAVVVGVGVMVGATLTLRLIDSIWRRS